MKPATKLMMLVITAMFLAPTIGCGVGTTPEDNARQVRRIADYDARMLVDDLGLLFQTNRTVRTSRWTID